MNDTFNKCLSAVATRMETALGRALPEPAGPQAIVMEAMRYASLGGGKRLRPFLLVETAKMLGYEQDGVWQAAAALECIHVYSLIHDDLPCMDDDDLRRGKPTVHKKYDEAIAVLAGDALQAQAFELLAREDTHSDPQVRLALVRHLAFSSGTHGMVGGQVIDMQAGGFDQDDTLITLLQALKTGALIEFAVRAGGLMADASAKDLGNLGVYARALGLAFQIRDDILDAEGNAQMMGKAAGKDSNHGKATFVSIHGLEGAKLKAQTLGNEAKDALAPYGAKAEILTATIDFVLNRQK